MTGTEIAAGVDDVEQIKLLKARYFRLLDTKQWDAWKDVFTEDLAITVERDRARDSQPAPLAVQPQGREGFVEALRVTLGDYPTVHHGHMPEITLTGPDTARGIWSMEDVVEFADGRVVYGYGHYHEDYRKEAGTWRIAKLHLSRLRMDTRRP
jgi:hypothetical protein